MAAKNGSNSGLSSGLPPTLEKICAPMAPRSLMARSTSRAPASGRRQRGVGDEGWEVLGVLGDQLGQAVVGEPRQVERDIGAALAHGFQGRHGDGQHLRIVGELLATRRRVSRSWIDCTARARRNMSLRPAPTSSMRW